MKKIFYSWADFDRDCWKLAEYLRSTTTRLPGSLWGIPRGGLVVAVKLSHILNIKLRTDYPAMTSLIVDDISDSGKTMIQFTRDYPLIYGTATLWIMKNTLWKPDYYLNVKEKEDWIVFPWETDESSKYDGTVK